MKRERIRGLLDELKLLVNDLQDIVRISVGEFLGDMRNKYAVRHLIVEIIEVASNIGLVILRDDFGVREVMGYSDIFRRLRERSVLGDTTGIGMEKLARLRNMIIHRYWEIDDARIYNEVKSEGIRIIKNFIMEVEKYVSER